MTSTWVKWRHEAAAIGHDMKAQAVMVWSAASSNCGCYVDEMLHFGDNRFAMAVGPAYTLEETLTLIAGHMEKNHPGKDWRVLTRSRPPFPVPKDRPDAP